MTTYVARHSFGWFETADEMIKTAERRVFACRHVPADRTYLLRLPTEETGDWSRAPRNATLEIPDIRETVAATSALYSEQALAGQVGPDSRGIVFPEYYGVLDERYLVPVTAVYRRRGAVPFESLLAFPDALIRVLPFWENLWLLLTSETSLVASGTIAFDVWEERWRHLVQRSALGRQLLRDLPADLSGRVATRIAAIVDSDELGVGPSFEESSIVRLMTAKTGKQLTEEQIAASLACPFFRMNITVHDLHYAVALLGLVQPRQWLIQSPLEWLGPTVLVLPTIVDGLLAQPSAFPDDAAAFERYPPPDEATLTRFSLFLRDPERTVRPYLALQEG